MHAAAAYDAPGVSFKTVQHTHTHAKACTALMTSHSMLLLQLSQA